MNKNKQTSLLWLNLVPALHNILVSNKNTKALDLQNGTLDVFPENPKKYHTVFAQLNTDFLNWQRWHFQCFAHQLSDKGYLFLKGKDFPKPKEGITTFLRGVARWFLGRLACVTHMSSIQQRFISPDLLALTEQYGLRLVAFPSELWFLKNRGILFQKREIAEERTELKLQNKEELLSQIKSKYADRYIADDAVNSNAIELIPVSKLMPQKNSTVLVLAPHPDDELVGCGGTLLALSELGAKIHILQMSEGVTCSALKNEKEAVKRTVRLNEAKSVAKHFGFEQSYWTTHSDSALLPSKENEDKLLKLLEELKPDLIFAPSDSDHHHEHQVAYQVLSKVLKTYPSEVSVLKYPVWGGLNTITYAIDITEYSNEILDAMYRYKTAMKAEDYNARMQTIWAYQALLTAGSPKQFVEVFSL